MTGPQRIFLAIDLRAAIKNFASCSNLIESAASNTGLCEVLFAGELARVSANYVHWHKRECYG